jgi:hypothetical protein
VRASNNNLDVVRHTDGSVYLAFRSAPHHFANPETAIYLVRSRDEETWEFQARFAVGSDLRRLQGQRGATFIYRHVLRFAPG